MFLVFSLFATYLPKYPGTENDFVVASDSDLWPLKGSLFRLPVNRDLLVVNYRCYANFTHRNYRSILPISYIGARVGIWHQIMADGTPSLNPYNQSSDVIFDYLLKIKLGSSRKMSNDLPMRQHFVQHLINTQLERWKDKEFQSEFGFSGETLNGKIDCSDNTSPHNYYQSIREHYNDFYDIRLPTYDGYKYNTWMPLLLRLMYNGKHSPETKWSNKYTRQFRRKLTKVDFV